MKIIFRILLSILLTACGGGSSNSIISPPVFYQNLKYFGFWDSGSRTGNGVLLLNQDSITATSHYTNTAVISVIITNDGNVSSETLTDVNLAIQQKEHIILLTWTAFMNYPLTNNDFAVRWETVKTQLINPNLSSIVALYIADEPFLNAKNNNISIPAVVDGLNTQLSAMKADYPNVFTYITYSTPELDNQDVLNYGPPVDMVGVNVYYIAEHDPTHVSKYFDLLAAQKKPLQNIALTMDSFFYGTCADGTSSGTCLGSTQVCMPTIDQQNGSLAFDMAMIDWVNSHPQFIVSLALPFLYNNQLTGQQNICGAESMPSVLLYLGNINTNIK